MQAAAWPTNARGVFLGGIFSGIVAGAVMLLFAMFLYLSTGYGFLTPPRFIGDTLVAGLGSVAAIILGIVFHLCVSAVLGVAYASLFRYSTAVVAALCGVVFGLLIWAVNMLVVVPLLDSPLTRSARATRPGWIIAHILFGAFLGLVPGAVSRFSKPAGYSGRDLMEEGRRAA